jgi:hypothetical protein
VASRAALVVLALATSAAGAETTILPGWWETTNEFTWGATTRTVERRCVRADEIDRFLSGPSNRHYSCEYPSRVVGDGRMAFEGSCRDKHGRSVGVYATGTYTPESFVVNAQIQAQMLGFPITATGVSTGRRLSAACPEDPGRPQ